jgi:hypothetical protein
MIRKTNTESQLISGLGKWLMLGALGATLAIAPNVVSAQNVSGIEVPTQPTYAKDAKTHGKQLADYVDKFNTGWTDSFSKSTIVNISADGEKAISKTTQLTLEGDDGNRAIVRYQSPANVSGVAMLTHEHHKAIDESWLYLPSNRRVRRISGANRTSSFQGTEFTYEDLSSLVPSRYKWKYIKVHKKNGVTLHELEALPTDKNSGYSKLHYFINDKRFRADRIDYYDKGGRLLKTLTLSKWKQYHGRFWRPNLFEMHNKQNQKRSTFEASVQFLNISKYKKKDGSPRKGLQTSAFTRRALESR